MRNAISAAIICALGLSVGGCWAHERADRHEERSDRGEHQRAQAEHDRAQAEQRQRQEAERRRHEHDEHQGPTIIIRP
jgi:hypothetical protein